MCGYTPMFIKVFSEHRYNPFVSFLCAVNEKYVHLFPALLAQASHAGITTLNESLRT